MKTPIAVLKTHLALDAVAQFSEPTRILCSRSVRKAAGSREPSQLVERER